MAYFLFIDESGHDRRDSPHEVLAGIAVEDRDLWNLIYAVQQAEIQHFGRRYSMASHELKGKKLLKRKVFRLAKQLDPISQPERTKLAAECLNNPATAGKQEMTALAQAKEAYVQEVLTLCSRYRCKAFASVCAKDAPRPESSNHLRKDYAFLFERFFYFIQDQGWDMYGAVVFDELEKAQSHLLIDQMSNYFLRTAKGRERSSQIIPEPFFVHSDLTTGIQLADLVAYLVNWGYCEQEATVLPRPELKDLVDSVFRLRYKALREVNGEPNANVWSFTYIPDLRTRREKVENEEL